MTLNELTARLSQAGIENADLEARLLICRFESISPALLCAERDRNFTSAALQAAVDRRLQREPLQYVLGEVGFYGEEYEVSPACLIPRADTELLVEEAIRRLPRGAVFADLCTGSGCIAISVLAHRRDLSAVAVDVSEEALSLARRNAVKNGVSDRISFLCADLLTTAPADVLRADAILSNPPYIRSALIPSLSPEVRREPSIALDGGEDGLCFYRRMLSVFHPPLMLFEIGYDQREALLTLGKEAGYTVSSLTDLGGNDRVIVLESAAPGEK